MNGLIIALAVLAVAYFYFYIYKPSTVTPGTVPPVPPSGGSTPPPASVPLTWQDQQCWKDDPVRALPNCPNCETGMNWGYDQCRDYAESKGYNAFALQFGGQCFAGNYPTNDYKKYGVAPGACSATGGGYINRVWHKK